MKERYKDYCADELITVSKRRLYTDADGFPNDLAFCDFVSGLTADDDLCLACLNIDLRASNKTKGYAFGTLVLRKVFLQLQEYFYVFRFSGEKFNVVFPKQYIAEVKKMLDTSPKKLFTVYYGITEEPLHKENVEELRRAGIDLMYRHKAEVTGEKLEAVRDDRIIGDKGNTPAALQETDTHKNRATMWYSVVDLDETSPNIRTVKAYVFPTEYKDKKLSLHQLVVIDDLVNTRLYTGNSVCFGFDGMRFNITTRFDANGKLSVLCYKDSESKGLCNIEIQTHEGSCIPASFGKRVEGRREIYPVKPLANGAYSYVLYDKTTGEATLNETGIFESDGKKYVVSVDETSIDLILQ